MIILPAYTNGNQEALPGHRKQKSRVNSAVLSHYSLWVDVGTTVTGRLFNQISPIQGASEA